MGKMMKKLLLLVLTAAMFITTVAPVSAATQSPTTPVVPSSDAKKAADNLNAGLKVTQTGKKINVTWGKVSDADGYDVYYAYCGEKFGKKGNMVTVKKASSIKKSITKIDGKALDLTKNFKIYVQAWKMVNGKKVVIAKTVNAHIVGRKNTTYTNVKDIKITSKTKVTLKKGKTSKLTAKVVLVNKNRKMLDSTHAPTFRYASTNTKVATVTKKGVIKAKGKGTCYVYVYAKNGFAKKVKVTVK